MPEPRGISDPSPSEMCERCIEHAESGLADARALADRGSLGRARSLVLLAYEDAMQAVAYHWVARGWATFDPQRKGEVLYISEGALRNHPLKQLLIAFLDPAVRSLARDVAAHVQHGEPTGVAPEAAVAALLDEAEAPPLPLSQFNRMKNDGFYPAKAEEKHPYLTNDGFNAFAERITRRVKVVKALTRATLSPEAVETVRDSGAELASKGYALDQEFLAKVRLVEKKSGRRFADVIQDVAGSWTFHDE